MAGPATPSPAQKQSTSIELTDLDDDEDANQRASAYLFQKSKGADEIEDEADIQLHSSRILKFWTTQKVEKKVRKNNINVNNYKNEILHF